MTNETCEFLDLNDQILIDTNILIYVFYPMNTRQKTVDYYTNILESMRINKTKIYLTSTVISEFVNVCIRADFKSCNKDGKKDFKKDYRNSERYNIVLNQILNSIKKLQKNFNTIKINDNFEDFDIMKSYNNSDNDFNDLILAHIANKYNLKLLTNDYDFKKLNVTLYN